MGSWMTSERSQYVVDKFIDEKPDLLLLTGDYLLGMVLVKTKSEAFKIKQIFCRL